MSSAPAELVPAYLAPTATSVPVLRGVRPRVHGKFLVVGDQKLYIKGVTYGTFRPDQNGDQYPHPKIVQRDFALMAANNVNAVRGYTVPPRWFLDLAQEYNLRVMVGLPEELYAKSLADKSHAREFESLLRSKVQAVAGHPALLCFSIGNEIPAATVRWQGRPRMERYLERLYNIVKDEDPDGLVTYVNYPSTEYLTLPFLDLFTFNVYLESDEKLSRYLARLHNLAGDLPVLMAEIGLDSLRNGVEQQARTLDTQIRTVFDAGCAGAFVYSWTDEWYRGGVDIDDWAFGITDADRNPKPALNRVARVFSEVPFPAESDWPRVSVVVCSYNGSRTIRECLEGVTKLDYPDYEVIVIDDGSTDSTAAIAREFDVDLISTENRGLSSARNLGLEVSSGEIVAYLDDDASPDPHWLTYLASSFRNTEHAGMGGPNIGPPNDGLIADCVANSPGNPVHVLISDELAEHIPGCNMAFRRDALMAVGGFDTQFRVAGDDVDLCWRIWDRGWTLGFNPSAIVWHHRRNSIRAYWKQQVGYGKAEALLEPKWPEKYNHANHLTWSGRVYGKGLAQALRLKPSRVYHGVWGSAPFQTAAHNPPGIMTSLPLMPEWTLMLVGLLVLTAVGLFWTPLLLASPLLLLAAGVPIAQAILGASKARFTTTSASGWTKLKLRSITAFLHLMQPIARLYGRLRFGLAPWRLRGSDGYDFPWPSGISIWSERWQSQAQRLEAIESELMKRELRVVRGGDYDRWDLEVRGGLLGVARLRSVVEEYGSGRQITRFRWWPSCPVWGLVPSVVLAALGGSALESRAWLAAVSLLSLSALFVVRSLLEASSAMAAIAGSIQRLHEDASSKVLDGKQK